MSCAEKKHCGYCPHDPEQPCLELHQQKPTRQLEGLHRRLHPSTKLDLICLLVSSCSGRDCLRAGSIIEIVLGLMTLALLLSIIKHCSNLRNKIKQLGNFCAINCISLLSIILRLYSKNSIEIQQFLGIKGATKHQRYDVHYSALWMLGRIGL